MEIQQWAGLSHALQTIVAASLVFAACVYLPRLNFKAQLAKLPPLDYEGGKASRMAFIQSAKKMYIAGYKQFKDRVYRMVDIDGSEVVIVAPKFLPELRRLPDSVLSFPKAVNDTLEVKYTRVQTEEPLSAHAVKADLTPALVRLNPLLTEEVHQAIDEDIGSCKDWTPVPIYMKLVSIVAKVSGRVFVGSELCRNQEYLDAGINYTIELIGAQRAIKQINPWLRPFYAPRLPQVQRLRQRERAARDFLAPVVAARRAAEKNPDYQKPEDLLQMFMNRGDDFNVKTPAQFGRVLLGIIFAAIHTTTLVTTNILYNLAVQPEYVQPLREEIRAALAETGGVITSRTLQKMERLDSYMKEVMRFYPPGSASFNRKVLKGFTLSNGQYIPAGVKIEVPSFAIYQDSEFYPDSETFDGFRFAKLRQPGDAASHARNQFVTSNEQNVAFGYGRHACPGRFFAANEIKMILCRLILEYDFKNMDGSMTRYPNQEIGRASNPDPTKLLLFKKAQV